MGNYFEQLGLGHFTEDDESFMGLVEYIASNGYTVTGYSGRPYINHHLGDIQVILHTEKLQDPEDEEDETSFAISAVDTHIRGLCVWDLRCSGIDLTPKDALVTEKRCMFTSVKSDKGAVPITVINADLLPNYHENEVVQLQMAAFALNIDYFETEQEAQEAFPENEKGVRTGLKTGYLFPAGFMENHIIREDGTTKDADPDLDSIVLLLAKVKSIYYGRIAIDEQKDNRSFIICKVETNMGDLEIVHSFYQVEEEKRTLYKVGATILAEIVIQGDAAIYEHEKGIVRDEESNLHLLRGVFEGDDPERLRAVLTSDAVYRADLNDVSSIGADAVIERLQYVHENAKADYRAHLATITEVAEGEQKLPFEAGKRCLVLTAKGSEDHESIAFIECDENGNITWLHTTAESRYAFKLDPVPEEEISF